MNENYFFVTGALSHWIQKHAIKYRLAEIGFSWLIDSITEIR